MRKGYASPSSVKFPPTCCSSARRRSRLRRARPIPDSTIASSRKSRRGPADARPETPLNWRTRRPQKSLAAAAPHDRRHQADRTIARHKRHQTGADGHQQNRKRQRLLAPLAITIGAEKNRTDRAGEKRNAECAERDQERDGFVGCRKEHLRNNHREVAVDQDFVKFERIADRRSNNQPHRRARAV